jgi:arsenate reductase
MQFIEYPKCSTCIKAKKFLVECGLDFDDRNIKLNNPTKEELKKWHLLSGLPLKKLFNTSGLIYKDLGLSQKLATMSEEEQFELLSSNGMLVKRPILVLDNKAYFGFKKEEREKELRK